MLVKKRIKLIKKNFHSNIKDNLISNSLKGSHFKNCLYILSKIAKHFKIPNNIYLDTIKNFKGLPHRQEIIKIKNMKIQLKRTSENLNNSDKMMETLVVEEKVMHSPPE